jgi:hypothetical protein
MSTFAPVFDQGRGVLDLKERHADILLECDAAYLHVSNFRLYQYPSSTEHFSEYDGDSIHIPDWTVSRLRIPRC